MPCQVLLTTYTDTEQPPHNLASLPLFRDEIRSQDWEERARIQSQALPVQCLESSLQTDDTLPLRMWRDRQFCPFGTCADKTSLEAMLAIAIESVYCDLTTPHMQMRHGQGHCFNLSAVTQTWSQPSCPSGGRLLPTLWHDHITEYYTATKKHRAVLFPEWKSCQQGVPSTLPFLQVVHKKVSA